MYNPQTSALGGYQTTTSSDQKALDTSQMPDRNVQVGVYWLGQDGNRWVKDSSGTRSVGRYTHGADDYWNSNGYGSIIDPKMVTPYGASATRSPYYSTGTSGTYASDAPIQDDLNYLNDSEAKLNQQYGWIDKTQQDGINQINDDYNKSFNRYGEDKARAIRDLSNKREDTQRQQSSALERIDTGARTLADSLRRRLGLASGSNSSAYQITAPGAVARQAGEQRTGVMGDYASNWKNLDIAGKDTESEYERMLQDLEENKKTRQSGFEKSILDKRNEVKGSLAEIARKRAELQGSGYQGIRSAMSPYEASINANEQQINGLFDKYRTPYTIKQAQVYNPDLKQYMIDKTAVTANNQKGYSDYSQYYRRPQDEEEKQLY